MKSTTASLTRRSVLRGGTGLALAATIPPTTASWAAGGTGKTTSSKTASKSGTMLITHPSFAKHDTGPRHPERPQRMRILDKVFADTAFDGLQRAAAPFRNDFEVAVVRAHTQQHYDAIFAKRPNDGAPSVRLDPDTILSDKTWEAAVRSIGAGMFGVDQVMDPKTGVKNVFCQVRPPGHHAESKRAMGFCLFNSIAVAALHAKAAHGAERVAIVDFDVHHGNGTQEIFWSNKNVFFASTHQMPLYPWTGAINETGVGNIFNAPLRPGDDGGPFRQACKARILNNLSDFRPDIILISAGFDAHILDPLANLRLVEADFHWITEQLLEIAARRAGGRVVSMLEGGYDLGGLGKSAAAHVEALMSA